MVQWLGVIAASAPNALLVGSHRQICASTDVQALLWNNYLKSLQTSLLFYYYIPMNISISVF